MTADTLEVAPTVEPYDARARVEEEIRLNPARLYTFAEARRLILGPDAPDDQRPTENWFRRQGGLGAFNTVLLGRTRYLRGTQILQLIDENERGAYGLPVHTKKK